jgi:hypothetical protein
MPEEWFVSHDGRTHGPIRESQLLDQVRRGELPWDTQVWHGSAPRWLRLGDCEALAPALVERHRREAAARLAVPPPPPGEPWFYPVSAFTVAVLNLVTLGFYRLVWRHQHRVWALRRAGLPTSFLDLFLEVEFPLPHELVEAAERTGVRLRHDPTATMGPHLGLVALLVTCFPVGLLVQAVVRARDDSALQRTANRLNSAVAPRRLPPFLGWAEVGVLAGLSAVWLGLLLWVRVKLLG